MAVFVHLVVGKLKFLEGDNLLLELVSGVGRVWVGVEAVRRRRVSLARHQPRGPVIRVPVESKAGGEWSTKACVRCDGVWDLSLSYLTRVCFYLHYTNAYVSLICYVYWDISFSSIEHSRISFVIPYKCT